MSLTGTGCIQSAQIFSKIVLLSFGHLFNSRFMERISRLKARFVDSGNVLTAPLSEWVFYFSQLSTSPFSFYPPTNQSVLWVGIYIKKGHR